MKEVVKYLGIISILAGVIILSLAVALENQTNAKLLISLILIVVGLFGHILLNKFID